MKKFFKRFGILVLIMTTLFAARFFWNYGIYDHRNLPAKIHVTAKADSGLHVHISVNYYRERVFRGFCTALVDFEGNGGHLNAWEEIYNDIPESGIDIVLKRSYPDFCRSKFDELYVSCTKLNTLVINTSGQILPIYPYQEWKPEDTLYKEKDPHVYSPPHSSSKIPYNYLKILQSNNTDYFFICEKECVETTYQAIDSTDKTLNISCKEGHNAIQNCCK